MDCIECLFYDDLAGYCICDDDCPYMELEIKENEGQKTNNPFHTGFYWCVCMVELCNNAPSQIYRFTTGKANTV